MVTLYSSKLFANSIPRVHLTIRRIALSYLVDKREFEIIQQMAMRDVWKYVLLGKQDPVIIDNETGTERYCDSGDETDDGVWVPDLNYVNGMWKLHLARDSNDDTLIDKVITMLGRPPTWGSS